MAELIPRARIPETSVGALPGVRPDAPTSREPIVQAMSVAQRGLAEIGQQWQEREDTAALLSARNELRDWENQVFNPNNPDGIGKYRGANALGAGELVPMADERIGQIRDRLSPRQQARFDEISGNFRDNFSSSLNRRMESEHNSFREAESKAALDNMGDDAVAAGVAGDFSGQDLKATELLGMVRARASAEGWGPERLQAAERQAASNIRSRTIIGMSTSEPFKAWDYYQQHQGQLSPEDRLRVIQVLDPVVKDAEYQTVADRIIGGAGAPGTTDVDAQIESLEGTGKNPGSTAVGTGQFLDGTWLEQINRHRPDLAQGRSKEEILALRSDSELGREMIRLYREDNARHLTSRGVQPTPTALYAAHHFGPGGGVKFMQAGDDTPMKSLLSAKEYAANPYLQGKTKGEVLANWQKRGLAGGGGTIAGGGARSKVDALEVASAIADPREREGVIRKINQTFAIRDAREAEQEKALSESTYTAITQNADPSLTLAEVIGPEAFEMATRKGRIPALENMRTAVLTNTLIKDDPILADSLFREAVISPNEFQKRDLYSLQDRLSTQTLSQLLKMQNEVTKPGAVQDWATDDERLNNGFIMLGIGLGGDATGSGATKKNAEREQERGEFRLAVMAAERGLVQTLGGKKPTPEQKDALVRNMARQFAERRAAGELYQTVDGKRVGIFSMGVEYETQISEADRAAVRAAWIEKYKHPPTDAQVTRYIIAKRGGATQ